MKRMLLLLLSVILLLGTGNALSETVIDWDSMETEEIVAFIGSAKNQLLKRAQAYPDNKILYSQDGFEVILKSSSFSDDSDGTLRFVMTVINDTDSVGSLWVNVYINGWAVNSISGTQSEYHPKTRTKSSGFSCFYVKSAADITSLKEVDYVQMYLYVRVNRTSETIGPITLVYSEKDVFYHCI